MFSKCFHEHSEHQKSRLFKRLFDILYTIQTPLRTAFHDTQRLLLEVYISNVRSVFVFFAPLMKK